MLHRHTYIHSIPIPQPVPEESYTYVVPTYILLPSVHWTVFSSDVADVDLELTNASSGDGNDDLQRYWSKELDVSSTAGSPGLLLRLNFLRLEDIVLLSIILWFLMPTKNIDIAFVYEQTVQLMLIRYPSAILKYLYILL